MEKTAAAGTQYAEFVVPVVHEQLQLGRRRVDTGRGVRIHKRVSERQHQFEAPLQHDALEVKRVPVDRIVPLDQAPRPRQEGDTLIVPVVEEVLVLEKRLRITEEVHITRHVRQHTHAGSVTLRAEQVAVERFDEGAATEATTTDGGSHHATDTRSRI